MSSRPLAHLRHHGMECEDSKDRKDRNILPRAIVAVRAHQGVAFQGRRLLEQLVNPLSDIRVSGNCSSTLDEDLLDPIIWSINQQLFELLPLVEAIQTIAD